MMKTFLLIALIAAPAWTETTSVSCKEGTDEYCAMCTSDKCSICYNSSLTTKTGVCTAVDPEVANCSSYNSDAKTCKGCKPNGDKERYVASNKCEDTTMKSCLKQTDSTTCVSCDGVMLKGKECTDEKCTTLDENCLSCTDATSKTCGLCKSGYKLSSDFKKCEKTTETATELKDSGTGCNKTTDGVCKTCMYGYYVNSKSSADKMTCAKSTKYTGVSIIKTIALALFAIGLF